VFLQDHTMYPQLWIGWEKYVRSFIFIIPRSLSGKPLAVNVILAAQPKRIALSHSTAASQQGICLRKSRKLPKHGEIKAQYQSYTADRLFNIPVSSLVLPWCIQALKRKVPTTSCPSNEA
jgi:hypothetical protein